MKKTLLSITLVLMSAYANGMKTAAPACHHTVTLSEKEFQPTPSNPARLIPHQLSIPHDNEPITDDLLLTLNPAWGPLRTSLTQNQKNIIFNQSKYYKFLPDEWEPNIAYRERRCLFAIAICIGADPNTFEYTSPFIDCLIKNDYELVAYLLSKGANPNSRMSESHEVPLVYVAWCQDNKIAKLLISYGANINAVCSHDGRSMLIHAVKKGNKELCKILVNHQKELENRMFTLLGCLKRISPSDACAQLLYRHRKELLMTHLKCYTMKMLLNAKDNEGNTAYSLCTPIRKLNGQESFEFLKPTKTERKNVQ